MILLDANLLLYAVNTDAPQHSKAKSWVEETLSGSRGPVLLSWFTLVAFVRIATNAKALTNPFSLEEALRTIVEWLSLPNVTIIHPGLGHALLFENACRSSNATGNLITDAHLAALAIEHGCEIASCDADFGKFPHLRWINPLTT
jgi:toxin-antitoxin system PIN domain toxin